MLGIAAAIPLTWVVDSSYCTHRRAGRGSSSAPPICTADPDDELVRLDKLLKFVHQASDFKVWFKSMCQLSVLTEVGYTCTKSATGEFHR